MSKEYRGLWTQNEDNTSHGPLGQTSLKLIAEDWTICWKSIYSIGANLRWLMGFFTLFKVSGFFTLFKVSMSMNLWQAQLHFSVLVRFTTTCVISAYHHKGCEFESCSSRGVLDTLCDRYDITEKLLQVVLITITPMA